MEVSNVGSAVAIKVAHKLCLPTGIRLIVGPQRGCEAGCVAVGASHPPRAIGWVEVGDVVATVPIEVTSSLSCPATDRFEFGPVQMDSRFILTNAVGTVVRQGVLPDGTKQGMEVEALPAGVYFLRVEDPTSIRVQRVVLQ